MGQMTADRRLYLAADQETVVEDGDPDAAFLLAAAGTTIPPAEVERLGLSEVDGAVVQGEGDSPEPEASDEGEEEDEANEDTDAPSVRVEQNGSWYTGYVGDEQVFKVQGEEAMEAAVAEVEG